MKSDEIMKYIDMALRRRYWIIIPLLLTVLAGLIYGLITPKMYQGETLILVVPQKVPDNYVRSIVNEDIQERLRTIQQQVTSRTNLEKIIDEYQLFNILDEEYVSIQEKVELFRKRITTNVARGSAFTISFQYEDPNKAMEVTNRLAGNFIAENLKIREGQATGTSEFLGEEVESAKRSLLEQENALAEYRERYMGGLPQQLDSNLRILERLQSQLEQLRSNLRDAEGRKVAVRTQLIEQSEVRAGIPVSPSGQGPMRDIQSLRNELTSLEARYTSKHPDIIRLKETIASHEREISEGVTEENSEDEVSISTGIDPILRGQLREIDLEIAGFNDELNKVQAQIAWYQKKVEETPKREQELLSLNRDYANVSASYNSLLNRKLEAEIAVSMERKQKGEQFRIIDPAKYPERPIKPDIRKILLMALALGLGLGGGMAFLIETFDTSYRTPEELEEESGIPVLVSIPYRYTEPELKARKTIEILKASSVLACFVLTTLVILFATKGVDKTLEYFKGFLGMN